MASAAETLKDVIEGAWNLTGELSKVTELGMDEVVQFFDHLQVIGNEVTKAVVVTKINAEGNENIIAHPNFNEVNDIYEITIRYRVIDVDPTNYSLSLGYIEDMGTEVTDILKTKYQPSSGTGVYFRTNSQWVNQDVDVGNQRDLRRMLRFSLTTITSDNPGVYTGYGGVLVFDTSLSEGSNNPGTDYTYVGVKNIDCREGFSQIPTLTKDKTQGRGIPLYMRGMFSGTFSALMYAEKSNIIGETNDKLQSIYRLQTVTTLIGQNAIVALLRTNTNSNSSTLSRTSFMKINSLNENSPDEDLITYTVVGTLTKPTTFGETT